MTVSGYQVLIEINLKHWGGYLAISMYCGYRHLYIYIKHEDEGTIFFHQ
jgi:hypothetical protein